MRATQNFRLWVIRLIMIVAVSGQTSETSAAPLPNLAQMPPVERVLSEVTGSDALDTAARQAGALYQLKRMIDVMSMGRVYRNQLTDSEKRLRKSYGDAELRILGSVSKRFDPYETRRLGTNSPRARWFDQYTHYQLDKDFEEELLGKFFTSSWQEEYRSVSHQAQKQRMTAQMQQRFPSGPSPQTGYFENILTRLGLSETQSLWLMVGVPAALLILGFAREIRRFGLDAEDPFMLRAGWTRYHLNSITGVVLSPTKSREVRTFINGGGASVINGVVHSRPVTTTTATIIHDQFFVRDASNREIDFKLTNIDLALREGQDMSVVWGVKSGRSSGNNLLFRNHSTRRANFIDRPLRDIIKPHKWPVLPFVTLSIIFYPGIRDLTVGIDGVLKFTAAVLVGFFIARSIVTHLRMRSIKRQIHQRLLPVLDNRASEQIVTPSGMVVTPG